MTAATDTATTDAVDKADAHAARELLAERALGGDTAAMGEVYRLLAPRVAAYCRFRGAADPEAATQEVFLRLLGRAGDITGGWGGLRAFAYSVAHGRCVDEHRRRGRQPGLDSYDPAGDPRAETSAEDQVLEIETAEELVGVIGLLPDDQRAVITLRVVADLSVRETAQVTGLSEAMVKKVQAKALSNLRRFLAPEDSDPQPAQNE